MGSTKVVMAFSQGNAVEVQKVDDRSTFLGRFNSHDGAAMIIIATCN